MKTDFEPLGHKDIELLRFYLGKDIRRIDDKIEKNEFNLVSYFVASLVDILVVVLFEDLGKELIEQYFKESKCIVQIMVRLGGIFLLIALFVLITFAVKKILTMRHNRLSLSGELEYTVDSYKQEKIDDFDNIACDGLLICQKNIQRFLQEGTEDYIKEFYYYEVMHNLEKARTKFSEIYENNDLYVAKKENHYNPELIDTYRVNNFIDFSSHILNFLKDHKSEIKENQDLISDLENLESKMSLWKKIE